MNRRELLRTGTDPRGGLSGTRRSTGWWRARRFHATAKGQRGQIAGPDPWLAGPLQQPGRAFGPTGDASATNPSATSCPNNRPIVSPWVHSTASWSPFGGAPEVTAAAARPGRPSCPSYPRRRGAPPTACDTCPGDEWRRTGRRPGFAVVGGPVVAVTARAAAPADDGPAAAAVRCRRGQLLVGSAAGSIFRRVGRDLTCGYQGNVRATVWQPSPIIGTPEGAVIILIGRFPLRAARPGGRSPAYELAILAVPVSQSPRSGLWGDDGEGGRGVSSTISSRWSAPRSPWCSTPSRPPPASMASSYGLVRVKAWSASPGPGFG